MLQIFVDRFTYMLFGADCNCAEATALGFFISNTLRASFVLLAVSFFISFLKSRIKAEKVGEFLEKKKLFALQYVAAAAFGAITPFCSCSSVSIFIALVVGKVPFGVACSFLICSPLVNEFALAMLLNSFGYELTFAYLCSGIAMASLGGFLFDLFGLKKYLTGIDSVSAGMCDCAKRRIRNESLSQKSAGYSVFYMCRESLMLLKSVIPYIVAGVALASIIKAWAPDNLFESCLGVSEFAAVPISVILGIPIYANNVAIVPLLESLVDKGVPTGVAISFMMASVGLSLPELLVLKRVFTLRLLVIFASTLAIMMTLSGYLFCILF